MGMGAIFTLVEKFPVKLLYYHYHFRKPIVWSIFLITLLWQLLEGNYQIPFASIPPLAIMALSILLTYKVHQSVWFQAVYFPKMTKDLESLPLLDDSEMAVIEYEGITKAYSLNYVVHHHIVNDRFNDKIISLTYCAMCRSIIPFDVTEIGPLFVASFKNANMIVADKKTGTFFQQAMFNSIIGKLHPYSLEMISFQILPWEAVKKLDNVQIAMVQKSDMRPFSLPMPFVWKKVMSSELTPGLSSKDKAFPSKTRVIGITDSFIKLDVFYLKSEILELGVLKNDKLGFTLIVSIDTVNAYKNTIGENNLELLLKSKYVIEDKTSNTIWNIRGKYIDGNIKDDLQRIAISDEYYFSWKRFHPDSELLKAKPQPKP